MIEAGSEFDDMPGFGRHYNDDDLLAFDMIGEARDGIAAALTAIEVAIATLQHPPVSIHARAALRGLTHARNHLHQRQSDLEVRITLPLARALAAIAHFGDKATTAAIASYVNARASRPYVDNYFHVILGRLKQRGLVSVIERRKNAGSPDVNIYALTDAGHRVLAAKRRELERNPL